MPNEIEPEDETHEHPETAHELSEDPSSPEGPADSDEPDESGKRGPKPPKSDEDRCVYVNNRDRRCSRKARSDLGEGNLCKQHFDKTQPSSEPPELGNTHTGDGPKTEGAKPEAPKVPIGSFVQDPKELGTQIAKTMDMLIPFAGSLLLGPDFGKRLHAPPEGIETLGEVWGMYLKSLGVELSPGEAVIVFTILIYGPIGLEAFKQMSAEAEEEYAVSEENAPPTPVTDAGVKGAA